MLFLVIPLLYLLSLSFSVLLLLLLLMALLLVPHYSLGAFSCLFSLGSVPDRAKVATPPVTIFLGLLLVQRGGCSSPVVGEGWPVQL